MRIDESTYGYIEEAASQAGSLVDGLTNHIGGASEQLKPYKYKVFNDFMNEVRSCHIDSIDFIIEEFSMRKVEMMKMCRKMCASDVSTARVGERLYAAEGVLGHARSRGYALQILNDLAPNPHIPDANDRIYEAFGGYRKHIEECSLGKPLEDDPISIQIHGFYETTVAEFVRLFDAYDDMFGNLGVDVNSRMDQALSKAQVSGAEDNRLFVRRRRDGLKSGIDVATAAAGLGNAIVGTVLGAKGYGDVAKAGIGLCAAVYESLGEVPEGRESRGRKILKKISAYNDALELMSESNLFGELPEGASSYAELIVAGVVVFGGGKRFEGWRSSGKLEICIKSACLAGNAVNMVGGVLTGASVLSSLRSLPKVACAAVGIVSTLADCSEKSHAIRLNGMANALRRINCQLREYKSAKDTAKAKIMQGMLAVKKPKASPFVRAEHGMGISERLMEAGDVVVEAVGWF